MHTTPEYPLSFDNRDSQRVSRRAFCKTAGAVAVAALAGASSRVSSAQTQKVPSGRYFDIHTHIRLGGDSGESSSVKSLLGWMDASDIAQAVVLPAVSPEASANLLTSEFVLAETRPHRDRLIPFC